MKKIIDKYRMLNNAIKHGSISDNIKKLYPELIDKNYNSKDVTILDGILNITEDEIIECFTGFVSFIDEMYEYFEIMGYLSK